MNSIPIRDPTSKWYLPPTFYPLNIFPSFLSGTAYVFTGSLVPALYHCTLRTPFINLEDVFLTGLCASTQLRLKLTHNTVRTAFISNSWLAQDAKDETILGLCVETDGSRGLTHLLLQELRHSAWSGPRAHGGSLGSDPGQSSLWLSSLLSINFHQQDHWVPQEYLQNMIRVVIICYVEIMY